MGEDYQSEERTEPFSQSEFDLRLRQSIQVEDVDDVDDHSVPLDKLVVDEDHHKRGVRILVRPLTRSRSVSPGNDSCEWLALRAEVAAPQQPKAKVLAVTQTSKDINFSIRIPADREDENRPPLWCELYYDPASDNQILLNRSDDPITLTRVSDSNQPHNSPNYEVVPGTIRALTPGTWRISVYGTAVLDFRILEKRPVTLRVPDDSSAPSSSGDSESFLNMSVKRSFTADHGDENAAIEKRLRLQDSQDKDDEGVIMFLGPTAEPLVFPLPNAAKTKEVAIPNGHALLEIDKDETVSIPGGCELDQYQLTKREHIATTAASSVFTAQHSNIPDGVITVKVLKTTGGSSHKPQDNHRNVIRQADVWLREYRSQEDMKHESIVKLYGGDARYLSLYMEHIDGKDLAARDVWRDSSNDLFRGDRTDALRILNDIAGALHYVHGKKKVHNDIKPANILYSRDRGAVLCDFGLSTRLNDPATNGGTPYYVPPEFLGQKLRGPPSDVWALGVTMLYVLRKIGFPDARGRQGHPKQLYWMIAEVNRPPRASSSKTPPAGSQMRRWLQEINDAKTKLNTKDKLEALILQMLIPDPNQRITMATVMTAIKEKRVT